MGHSINYMTCKNDSISKKIAIADICDEVAENNHESGLYHHNLTWHDDIVAGSEEEARRIIDELDKGWYDDHAVLFKVSNKPSKAMKDIDEKLSDVRRKFREFNEQSSVKNFTATYIGCKNCGSKLSREHLRGNDCPLCWKDLRSKTATDRLTRYKQKEVELLEKYHQAEIKNNKNSKNLMWLIKYEYHV